MGQVLTGVTYPKKLFLMNVSDSISVETSIALLSPPSTAGELLIRRKEYKASSGSVKLYPTD